MSEKEPTISDVLNVVSIVRDEFLLLRDELLFLHQEFLFLREEFSQLREEFREFGKRLTKVELLVIDIKDSLDDLTEAESKAALATINHEQRIRKVEKRLDIKAAPVKHLRGV